MASIALFYNLGRQINNALEAGKRLDKEADSLSGLQNENKKLRDRLSWVSTYDYVQSVARNKLNLAKDNETMVIIPDEAIQRVLGAGKKPTEEVFSNWQGWLRLIFH